MNRTNRWRAMRSKPVPLFLLFQLFALIGFSQVRVTGKVSGADNNPIAGASVMIKNTNAGASTDGDGRYTVAANLKAGTYTLEFSAVGFRSKTQSLQVGGAEGNYTLNVQLEADALGLEEIVVTGNPTATKRKQLGNYVTSVNSSQLSGTGANNPIGALSGKVAGAQISQNTGNPAGGFSVRLRGAAPSTLLLSRCISSMASL